ncbi:manganese and iron superoxide dismutase [Aulographum hederae CBS 113979]|uniref:Manganese and iron superoxide dismutase n=1 Tax=Aulographum hederae CBS 113979 TaxID=1176131 RepID=A0A6G1GUV2_9PEZI|nr:manganese and iron superoxide dismutase [Aulographum hederae CBS 113979]
MILRPIATSRQPLLRAAKRCTLDRVPISQPCARRHIRSLAPLKHFETFERNGVPNFLSSHGFLMGWTQYQKYLTNRLDNLTKGTTLENLPIFDIINNEARNPAHANLFNYASALWNNHCFFEGLSPSTEPVPMSRALESQLLDSYPSIETLKKTFVGTASAMFGPGYVWLVRAKIGQQERFRVLATYNAGTPFPQAHWRRQPIDANNHNEQSAVQNRVGSFGRHSAKAPDPSRPPGYIPSIRPIVCVSTWPHVHLRDYGFDKRRYLERFWDSIDWDVAEMRANASKDKDDTSTNTASPLIRRVNMPEQPATLV